MSNQPFRWTLAEVQSALAIPPMQDGAGSEFVGVDTDTRSIRPGSLFLALEGERFDAHDFVAQAVEAGSTGLVVSRPVEAPEHVAVFRVEDTLVALGALARHRRRALRVPVVGITGSVGKTTTKELVRAALATELRVHANRGNLNNRIGLPLTLLEAPDDVEVVVLEMGTNEPGEIAALTAIAEPDMGILSTVARAHLEKLGTVEGVFREKLALLQGLGEGGRALVGDLPPTLPERARAIVPGCRVAGWSPQADEDLTPSNTTVDEAGRFGFDWGGVRVALQLPGRHAVLAALLALGVATALGVSPESAAAGVASVEPMSLRGEVRRFGPVTLILDCYNANPMSISAGMDLLADLPARTRRVAILGSMLELGPDEIEIHQETLLDALSRPVDLIVASGLFAAAARQLRLDEGEFEGSERVLVSDDPMGSFGVLRPRMRGDEVVLLKGSRGVALERLVPLFEGAFEDETGLTRLGSVGGAGAAGSLDARREGVA